MFSKKSVLFLLFLFVGASVYSQKLKKQEKQIVTHLENTISYLASDPLQGRRTGTYGEQLAYEYLSRVFDSIGLKPMGDNGTYLQEFPVEEGRKILKGTALSINGDKIDSTDFFPLTFSADGSITGTASPSVFESDAPWFFDVKDLLTTNNNNPHFDLGSSIKNQAEDFKAKGATSVIVYNSSNIVPDISFNGKSNESRISIPVIYVKKNASSKYFSNKEDFINLSFDLHTGVIPRNGHNVIGYIDNGAPTTIIIGGHFDHLGYGEDHNSLWTGKPEINHGADDNASGTALVIEMARLLKNSKYRKNNYLFACFSGEELGLFGSKYLTEHSPIPLSSVNFMINCDMVGRLNPDTKTITVGGYGTSPYWSTLPDKTKYFNVKFDSSGIGPSDHTSFYLKNIPVLFFFTGTHSDYHKPTDVASKIDYIGEMRIIEYIENLIKKVNNAGKLEFLKTREPDMGEGRPRFTVTLGVMPDYTYSAGDGLKIDGVISGKIAEKAGMKAGDVITQIGDFKVHDINDYMKALSHFKKGDKTTIIFIADKTSKTVAIEF